MDREHDRYSLHSSDGEPNRKTVTTKTTSVTPYDPNSGLVPPPGTQEEWTTTKRRVNHKTKQVETRVQRQIIMEDGKVIADSGPQVTTKTTEDQKSDESEDTKHRRLGDSEVPEKYRKEIGNQVVSEKTVTRNLMREAKEENFQYHDESLRELEGQDIHRRAIEAPNELIRIDNELPQIPRGKLVHFSAKGRKINDRDEIQEVSRLDNDGLLSTETTQTNHHEEYEDDELPEGEDAKQLQEPSQVMYRQLEYGRPTTSYDVDEHRTSRTNSSLSVSRNVDGKHNKANKKWRDNHDSGDDSDIIETSDVYRLSDRMRSLKTSSGKKSSTKKNKGGRAKKDDASTQATLSDSDDGDTRRHRSKHEVHERIDSRRSTYDIPGDCCENIHHSQHNKPKSKYYFGTDRPLGDDGGHISANVKTSKFAMENNKVIEDKSFNEDFDRSFKNRDEMTEVRRDYDRFVERTKDHTKAIQKDRAISPMLPPIASSHNEYIHRPVLVDHHSPDRPTRSRSFYEHQIKDHQKTYQSSSKPVETYSTLPKVDTAYQNYRTRSPSPIRTGTWTKNTHHYGNDYNTTSTYGQRRPSYGSRANSRNDFPDFAPLSSPLEIKSLTENTMKSRHIASYN